MFKKGCREIEGFLPENCGSIFKELKYEYKLCGILSYIYSSNSLDENQ